jgi:hypothetical protein
MSDAPLTVYEARAILVADDAMALSFPAREATGNTLGLADGDAWQLMVASAKRRIARFEGGAVDHEEGSRR